MLVTSEWYEQIEQVLDAMDFEKIQRVMDTLDWHWLKTNGVPSLLQIRKTARYCLKGVIELIDKEDVRFHMGTGGFIAQGEYFINDSGVPELYLSLYFSVSDVATTTYGGYE